MSLQPAKDPEAGNAKPDSETIARMSIDDGEVVEKIAIDTINAESEYTVEEYRRLLWKIDLWLLPLMWLCYGTQQADKTAVSVQAVFGMQEDTNLHGQQFSWLTTIFYISYMVSEAPGNYLMQKFNMGRFLGVCMFLWGIVVLCIGFAHNWAGLMVLRALQGMFECTISPTFLIITGSWYTSREHTMRSIIWGTANSGMSVVTGLINYAIGKHADSHPGGLAAWKGISFFLGGLTIVLAVLTFFILGTPREVKWLSEREKRMAAARVVSNQTGSDRQKRTKWKWSQVATTFKDPQTYFFFLTTTANAIPNGGVTTFGNLVYKSFGFSSEETLIKGTIPQHAVSILWFLLVGYVTMKKPNLRFFFMIVSLAPAFAGMLALALLPKSGYLWVRWGLYLMTVTGNLPGLLIWTMLPSNVAGRTKKSVTATVLFVSYCTGNAIGAQVFQAKDAPRYIPGLTVCAILFGVEAVLMSLWRLHYSVQNRRRAKKIAESGLSEEECRRQGLLNAEDDMTDFDNIHFVYQL
ncbi:hypothetical protein CkaCkLH20_03885 [Colletotrichum karsti]|uniref:Major facilitator superfamily transporter n=1 Tax=Colletotrichum karsti TaxID=1095194 RepID=A0A9P6I6W9_9PEZI|nr:uncharacterized protein CkaCkLH20_03885 [Colletotrichum karsti]KAF9878393.1 hypothetical protein CkaCkLH20_03885 [Colletotrichum karsti]